MNEETIFQEKESKVGPLIGSLIVVVVLVVGALYFLSQKINDIKAEISQEEITTEMNSLEQELVDLNIDSVDQDVEEIEKEFDSN